MEVQKLITDALESLPSSFHFINIYLFKDFLENAALHSLGEITFKFLKNKEEKKKVASRKSDLMTTGYFVQLLLLRVLKQKLFFN